MFREPQSEGFLGLGAGPGGEDLPRRSFKMASYPYGALNPNAPSPLRRQNAAQPPMLVTASLNNAHHANAGLGLAVPGSTTSLSTPFSPFAALSPYAPAPSPASATVASPMALRSAASYTAPYNPQQWGPLHPDGHPMQMPRQQTQTVTYAPRMMGPDGREQDTPHLKIP